MFHYVHNNTIAQVCQEIFYKNWLPLISRNFITNSLKHYFRYRNLTRLISTYLLIPQIEHSVKCIALDCGSVVYKTDKNVIEECLSLESILKLPEIIECLDETLLFNIRLFYTIVYQFGMRNEVCHRLRFDSELQFDNYLAVWWFTLHILSMFSPLLHKRLSKQNPITNDQAL